MNDGINASSSYHAYAVSCLVFVMCCGAYVYRSGSLCTLRTLLFLVALLWMNMVSASMDNDVASNLNIHKVDYVSNKYRQSYGSSTSTIDEDVISSSM